MNIKNVHLAKKIFPVPVVLSTVLLAGTLDIIAAFIQSYLNSGISPLSVLQYIASGIFGRAAFSGGVLTGLLGLLFHYLIVLIWTGIFFMIFPLINLPSRFKIFAGVLYGIFIWVIMNIIVLPLSNVPQIPIRFPQAFLGIAFIIFLVGLPISLMYYKYNITIASDKV